MARPRGPITYFWAIESWPRRSRWRGGLSFYHTILSVLRLEWSHFWGLLPLRLFALYIFVWHVFSSFSTLHGKIRPAWTDHFMYRFRKLTRDNLRGKMTASPSSNISLNSSSDVLEKRAIIELRRSREEKHSEISRRVGARNSVYSQIRVAQLE